MFTFISSVFAQSEGDGARVFEKTVGIIPYAENEHHSDSDFDFSKASGFTPGQIRGYYRWVLEDYLNDQLKKRYNMVRFLNDSSDAGKDLPLIYRSFRHDFATQLTALNTEAFAEGMPNYLADVPVKNTSNPLKDRFLQVDEGKLIIQERQLPYYKAIPRSNHIFPYLQQEYAADYLVMISMIQIKKRYEYCLDLTNQNYAREVSIHYTIFSADGGYIAGEVVNFLYEKPDNNFKKLTEEIFPAFASYVSARVPY